MKILNFGSVNIDHVYQVDHFVRPGETLASAAYSRGVGGKGLNQSVALARAGAPVWHAGKIGQDGVWLRDYLAKCGVEVSLVQPGETPTGHAMIQVNREGENAIVLYSGANRQIGRLDVERTLAKFDAGDYLLLQNEVSAVPDMLSQASKKGLRVVFNPAPMTPDVQAYPLQLVDMFILNEVEGRDLTGLEPPEAILAAMRKRFPRAATVLTLGAQGVLYADANGRQAVPAVKVVPVDTTAAGDTFIGYFLADLMADRSPGEALSTACRAAALCVTRAGAADSIPARAEILGAFISRSV